jgi:N-acetylglutamate synthase-like GNAT family acetyltransferase
MTAAATLRVRRATIEDLQTLRPLWTSMHLPVAELEPRLTEFQVVENSEGKLMGGIGLQLGNRHARLHSEAFADFAIADAARELLWARIQTLASNHGILRLWTSEDMPFWRRLGFKPADAEALKKLPVAWNAPETSWFTLQLKDEAAIASVEKELAMFMAAEKQNSARVSQQAKVVKTLAMALALVLAIFVFGTIIYMILKRPEILHPGR